MNAAYLVDNAALLSLQEKQDGVEFHCFDMDSKVQIAEGHIGWDVLDKQPFSTLEESARMAALQKIPQLDGLAVDDEVAVGDLDGAVKAAVDGVVLGGVGDLLGLLVRGVDSDYLDVVADDAGTENQAADAAKTIDANFDAHFYSSVSENVMN